MRLHYLHEKKIPAHQGGQEEQHLSFTAPLVGAHLCQQIHVTPKALSMLLVAPSSSPAPDECRWNSQHGH